MDREAFEKKYDQEIYQKLNPEQQEAVDTVYGPVMVIAGPGTGKTQILSARIGKILLATDAYPENILCLTFTDAGRLAMRTRLQEMIGPEAYKVHIHTFHSFCNKIISENPGYFNKVALDPVSEIERMEILKSVIDGLSPDNPLKRYAGDVYYEIKNLSSFISVVKKEAWSLDFIREKIEDYIEGLPQREGFYYKKKYREFQAGDPKTKKIEEERDKMNRTLAALECFDQYQAEMEKRNLFDFEDMIQWVHQAFERDRDFLYGFQEQFQFILVDEYQDTNNAQNFIISHLIRDVEKPNIFVVGDDDQSIFRFQGANIENIESFVETFDEMKEVILKSNYRSTPPILSVAQKLICQNTVRLKSGEDKHLVSENPELKTLEWPIHLFSYLNPLQEMMAIVERISNLIQSGTLAKEIAVLYKENKYGDDLIPFLKSRNIPFYVKRNINLFKEPLARKVFNIIRYIAAEKEVTNSGQDLLFEILHYDLFNISAAEIAWQVSRLEAESKEEKYSPLRIYFQEKMKKNEGRLFRENENLYALVSKLEKWIQDSFNDTIMELLEKIFNEGGFVHYALKQDDDLWQMDILRGIMDFIKEELHRTKNHDLSSLVDLLDLMESRDVSIPLLQIEGKESGVSLLTLHSSKGLEFDHVFICSMNSSLWEQRRRSNLSGYALPDNLFDHQEKEEQEQRDTEELRRLFYVALTRAKRYLHISWCRYDIKESGLEASRFISEIDNRKEVIFEKVDLQREVLREYLPIYLLQNKKPVLDNHHGNWVEERLRYFELSPTSLNNFLKCPLAFYYRNIVRVPAGRNDAMAFGSAVHWALQRLFERMKENDNQFPEERIFLQDFDWFMQRNRELFKPEAFKRRMIYGEKVLSEIYNDNIEKWNKVVLVEHRFNQILIEGVPVNGMIDKIEFTGKDVKLIDYKTGKYENARRDKLRLPKQDYIGGDYWRQAVFYKLLVENYPKKDWNVEKCVFEFVEPDIKGVYHRAEFMPSQEEMDIVRKQIVETYRRIMEHDFYTGCGQEDCHYCSFVKGNKVYDRLEDIDR